MFIVISSLYIIVIMSSDSEEGPSSSKKIRVRLVKQRPSYDELSVSEIDRLLVSEEDEYIEDCSGDDEEYLPKDDDCQNSDTEDANTILELVNVNIPDNVNTRLLKMMM